MTLLNPEVIWQCNFTNTMFINCFFFLNMGIRSVLNFVFNDNPRNKGLLRYLAKIYRLEIQFFLIIKLIYNFNHDKFYDGSYIQIKAYFEKYHLNYVCWPGSNWSQRGSVVSMNPNHITKHVSDICLDQIKGRIMCL